MRLLVYGGRNYNNRVQFSDFITRVLFLGRWGWPDIIISGGATGADTLAMLWAIHYKVFFVCIPADWDAHGLSAGPIRNQLMLDTWKPDAMLGFPGGRGSADMAGRCDKVTSCGTNRYCPNHYRCKTAPAH